MRSKNRKTEFRRKTYAAFSVFCLLIVCLLSPGLSRAEIIDRVVAYVDDTAIPLSEFQKNYLRTKETVRDISREEVLNSMINSLLLLKEAKKMRLEAQTKDDLLKEYVDIKIKAAILIKEEAIEQFYRDHINDFSGKDYVSVRDEIERYLFELETNRQLKKHLEDLRSRAEIKIQLAEEGGKD